MTTFVFTELVPNGLESGALGANSSGKFADKDLGKAVKFGTANNFVLATGGDHIDGFVKSIEPFTVNDGFSFGGVLREGRIEALVGANQGGTPMAVGDMVVADTQAALGTAEIARVKTIAAAAGLGGKEYWRCIRLVSGTGVAGDKVLLERL